MGKYNKRKRIFVPPKKKQFPDDGLEYAAEGLYPLSFRTKENQMEFDTRVPLVRREVMEVGCSASFDTVHRAVYEVMQKESATLGDGPDGQIWADYSTRLLTRHIVCEISKDDEKPLYYIILRSGRRPSYLGDALLAFLFIGGLWGLSKCLVPDPPIVFAVLMIVCLALAGWFISRFGKAFGVEQCATLAGKIKETVQSLPEEEPLPGEVADDEK